MLQEKTAAVTRVGAAAEVTPTAPMEVGCKQCQKRPSIDKLDIVTRKESPAITGIYLSVNVIRSRSGKMLLFTGLPSFRV